MLLQGSLNDPPFPRRDASSWVSYSLSDGTPHTWNWHVSVMCRVSPTVNVSLQSVFFTGGWHTCVGSRAPENAAVFAVCFSSTSQARQSRYLPFVGCPATFLVARGVLTASLENKIQLVLLTSAYHPEELQQDVLKEVFFVAARGDEAPKRIFRKVVSCLLKAIGCRT